MVSLAKRKRFRSHRRLCRYLRPALCWHCRRHWIGGFIDGYGNLTELGASLVRDRRKKPRPAVTINADAAQTERISDGRGDGREIVDTAAGRGT
jgi:hypothetical protein